MRESETPYEYVLAVNRYLQDGFRYDEAPGRRRARARAARRVPVRHASRGYCQHFSGAMALLLRMGGIPARVVTGFSPGGYSKRKRAWIVRDTDAHSWVEAWFDDCGWVTFDPTPAGTPGAVADRGDRAPAGGRHRPRRRGGRRRRLGAAHGRHPARPARRRSPDRAARGPRAGEDAGGGIAWWWFALAAPFVLALVAWLVLRWRRRSRGPAAALDRAVAELEAALRRAGRPAAGGTTLQQLEQRLGRTPEAAAYLHALRAGRYAPAPAPAPTAGGRRALRRELASGGGAAGRLRALWALPPWRA